MTEIIEGPSLHVTPVAGEPWSRAAERFVAEEISRTPGYTATLQAAGSHGGDVIVECPDGSIAIIEVRSIDERYGAVPFFDVTRGLRAHRRLQNRISADMIIVIAIAITKPSGEITAIGAMGGERFEAHARRAERAYLAESGNRTRIARPVWIDEMDTIAETLPGVAL